MRLHKHESVIYREIPFIARKGYGPNRTTFRGTRLMMRCKICGKITYKDILNPAKNRAIVA